MVVNFQVLFSYTVNVVLEELQLAVGIEIQGESSAVHASVDIKFGWMTCRTKLVGIVFSVRPCLNFSPNLEPFGL